MITDAPAPRGSGSAARWEGHVSQPALEEQFEPTAGESVEAARARPSWELFRHRFRQDKAAMAGAWILLVLVVLALAAPLFAKLTGHGPNDRFPDQMLTADIRPAKGPNKDFWFGGDTVRRDVFVRTLYGARTSLTVALVATGLAAPPRGAPGRCAAHP